MSTLKFGYYPSDVSACRFFNRSSYFHTLHSCNLQMKTLSTFSYIQYLFVNNVEMIPFNAAGNFSDSGHMTSNNSAFQALQFGAIDGFLFTNFYITEERFKHFSFANPYFEDRFCLVMSRSTVYRHAEEPDNLFWLQPFSAPVWAMLSVCLLWPCLFKFINTIDSQCNWSAVDRLQWI